MDSIDGNREGSLNVLQGSNDNHENGDVPGALSESTSKASTSPATPDTTPAVPSAPPAELDISVGDTAPFDYGKKLFSQLNELKTAFIDTSNQLCNTYSKTTINDISIEDIKKSNKLQKKDLGVILLGILNKCSYLCFDTNLDSISDFKYDTQFQNLSSEVTKCVQSNLEKYSAGQDSRLKNIEVQINQLNSYTSYLNSHDTQPRHHGVGSTTSTRVQHTPSVLADVQINNPTKHIEESNNDFLPEELSNRVSVFLDGSNKFNVNTENGHSVAMFGYPYHYNGSKHTNQPTEIPSPIKEVLDAINEKYPNEELNSCLINKYHGPQSYLPKHADDEPTIAPNSVICTVSVGHSCTVSFSEVHGDKSHEHIAEPNSLYVMTRTSQAYWQHRIDSNSSLPENYTRYSLTFRHVDKKFIKSTIICGDSNTRNLKFGSGKGTFGHNVPGTRAESIHISDITPSACCGYKNIFIHCGINDIKHYRCSGQNKVQQKFNELKSKIEETTVLCPTAKLFVSPILPTKSQDWNKRAVYFNKLLFNFCNGSNGKVIAHNFSGFCDEYGNLRSDMGKYWDPSDPLHLGSNGIRSLVNIVRQCVFSSGVSGLSYSGALTGHSISNVANGHEAAQSGHPRFAAT